MIKLTNIGNIKHAIWKWSGFDLIVHFYRKNIGGFNIPLSPHFESEAATQWFLEKLVAARYYVEFGSGGSTYLAAKNSIKFITVDSDKIFLEAVRSKIINAGFHNAEKQQYKFADIGPTRSWGEPLILCWPSPERCEKFKRYSDFPNAENLKFLIPDFVLVDGRFRVACALKAFRALAGHKGWTVAIDDYEGRSYYKVIEEFSKPDYLIGKLAVFSNVHKTDPVLLDQEIAKYELDPR